MFILRDVGFRPIEEADLEKIRRLRNDPSTWMQLGGRDHITPDEQRTWYEGLKTAKDRAYFTVFENHTGDAEAPVCYEGDFMGVVRQTEIDYQNRSCLIGLDIDPGKRGCGWGTKVYMALLKWLFDFRNFHRVALMVLDTNKVGLRLYLNSGFKEEGRLREAIWRDGKFRDYILMSILESEYRRRS